MSAKRYFIEPLDVLILRGNKLFGDPGSFGESLVPPWPSVAAGALRSALLLHKGYDPARFARGEIGDDPELGTPSRPGTFTLTAFQLARRHEDGKVEALFPLPTDLIATRDDKDRIGFQRLVPHVPAEGILSSASTMRLAVLPEKERSKPVTGLWLTADGWMRHVKGESIDSGKHLVGSRELWSLDTRVGVGIDPKQRRAEDGKLFTVQAVALRRKEHRNPDGGTPFDVGFLAAVAGAELPEQLTLRLGGDGRGALARRVAEFVAEPDYEAFVRAGRCRLILTTPGLFTGGWRPNGTSEHAAGLHFNLRGVEARLVCAAVPRYETVSGFDLATWKPKPAQRVVPAGSVYWLEELEATTDALRKLAEWGLWSDPPENASRRAEGFNRCTFAAY